MVESISLIEPLMPSVENRQLVNLASELIEAAKKLASAIVFGRWLGVYLVMLRTIKSF